MLSLNFLKWHISEKYTLVVLGSLHALIDASCAMVVFSIINVFPLDNNSYLQLILLYNALAFGLQPVCGIAVDTFLKPRFGTAAGILFTSVSIVTLFYNPWLTVICCGVGNALFHVSGGVVALKLKEGSTAPSGYFVAPGAIGLAFGTFIGTNGLLVTWPFLILSGIALFVIYLLKFPQSRQFSYTYPDKLLNTNVVIVIFLMTSVALRSLMGFEVGGPWKGDNIMLFVIAFSAAFGKFSGGLIADRFGWQKTGTSALLLSSLFFILWPGQVWGIVCGTILLQMTMPVTLAALYQVFPGKPGLAFGLACLALVIGAIPVLLPGISIFSNKMLVLYGMPLSALCFYVSLLLHSKKIKLYISQKRFSEIAG